MNPIPNDLMAAIIERPDDDLLRLQVADWLEEHGEVERAEFIRVQIANPDNSAFSLTRNIQKRQGIIDPLDFPTLVGREPNPAWLMVSAAFIRDWAKIPAGGVITYRRGFPHSVRCTMADFMPGECHECDGIGYRCSCEPDSSETCFCSDYPCEKCIGLGKQPGLAATIGGWPVREIVFPDKQPMEFQTEVGHWRWLSADYGSENVPQYLPVELFKLLKPHGRGWGHDNIEAFYPTRKLALSALSDDAAIRFARGEFLNENRTCELS